VQTDHAHFFEFRHHDYNGTVMLPEHSPEVLRCLHHGTLCSDVSLATPIALQQSATVALVSNQVASWRHVSTCHHATSCHNNATSHINRTTKKNQEHNKTHIAKGIRILAHHHHHRDYHYHEILVSLTYHMLNVSLNQMVRISENGLHI